MVSFIENNVLITRAEYEAFLKDSRELDLLYLGGVEDWEGYEGSLYGYEEDEDEGDE